MLNNISRILIRVSNVPAAVGFYTQKLGLILDRQHPHAAALRFANNTTELILHTDDHRGDLEIIYQVTDVREMFEKREELHIQFLSPPQQVGAGYRATIKDPFGNILIIADQGKAIEKPEESSERVRTTLFEDAPDIPPAKDPELLTRLYTLIGRTADDLPYTRHFEELYSLYVRQLPDPKPSARDVWWQLINLRKRGSLPRLGSAVSKPPALDAEKKELLRKLLGHNIGKRDRLPYTPEFDTLMEQFNQHFARPFPPHVVWRMVANLAK
ncbi:MAG: hypothetical protein KatS3mg104_0615 [Phycisphaerae bacterium]|jgi:catechol 2,3-dioxygenase-like lactoylglutathione lyase family enzyme|nr:MAG: hypothetical protein KatS3mg104_0615 [Phycisphaerae bacterium]